MNEERKSFRKYAVPNLRRIYLACIFFILLILVLSCQTRKYKEISILEDSIKLKIPDEMIVIDLIKNRALVSKIEFLWFNPESRKYSDLYYQVIDSTKNQYRHFIVSKRELAPIEIDAYNNYYDNNPNYTEYIDSNRYAAIDELYKIPYPSSRIISFEWVKIKKHVFEEFRVTSGKVNDYYIGSSIIHNNILYVLEYYFVTDNENFHKRYKKDFVKIMKSIKFNE